MPRLRRVFSLGAGGRVGRAGSFSPWPSYPALPHLGAGKRVHRLGPVADQSEAPYLDAVIGYVARNPGRFHIPGHKGTGADPGLIEALGEAAVLHDVPAGIEGIDVG